jgi:hypothetical protein
MLNSGVIVTSRPGKIVCLCAGRRRRIRRLRQSGNTVAVISIWAGKNWQIPPPGLPVMILQYCSNWWISGAYALCWLTAWQISHGWSRAETRRNLHKERYADYAR